MKSNANVPVYTVSAPQPASALSGNVWVPDNMTDALQPGQLRRRDDQPRRDALAGAGHVLVRQTLDGRQRQPAACAVRAAAPSSTSMDPGEIRVGQGANIRGILNAPRANVTFEERSRLRRLRRREEHHASPRCLRFLSPRLRSSRRSRLRWLTELWTVKEQAMKRTMIFTAIVLLSTAISAQTVSFGPAPQVTSWTDTASSDSSLSVNGSKSANATASRTVSRSKTTCVVAADARGRIESVEVTYAAATRDGVGLTVAGRQYLVRRAANGVVVTHADGTAPDAEETAFVAGDNTHFARFAAMQRIFAGKTFAVGTSFQLSPIDATELAESFGWLPRAEPRAHAAVCC